MNKNSEFEYSVYLLTGDILILHKVRLFCVLGNYIFEYLYHLDHSPPIYSLVEGGVKENFPCLPQNSKILSEVL